MRWWAPKVALSIVASRASSREGTEWLAPGVGLVRLRSRPSAACTRLRRRADRTSMGGCSGGEPTVGAGAG